MKDYNQTWKYLHNKNYFKNHRMYNKFEIVKPHNVEINDIQNKCVLDIGMGYGRNMGWFAKHAEYVYGIEVTEKIIKEAQEFLHQNHINNFTIFKNTDYKDYMYNVDYVFSRYVFQHIGKDQCKEYIENIYEVLNPNGRINLQFRVGDIVTHVQNREPRTEYRIEEIKTLLQKFTITKIDYAKSKEHVFILGIKA